MTKHIGIVGVSPEGAALIYRNLSRHASRFLPPNAQPKISLHNEPLALYIDAIRKGDWHTVGRLLRKSAEIVHRCGADFCLSPDNVIQHGVQLAEVGSPIKWLTMPELVANKIAIEGRKTVGVIGTKMLMTSSTYQIQLGLKGIHLLTPTEDEMDTVDEIIFGELIYGTFRPESQSAVLEVIHNMAQRGCEAVILACSEAPLLITAENSLLPIYDPADILAEAAIRHAMEPDPAPQAGR
jgi:aspartate racemase